MKILCSISTKNRYERHLPMAIASVLSQTRKPDHFAIYDDNDTPKDLRTDEIYLQLFRALDAKGIPWDVSFGAKLGQHYNHQRANMSGYDAVWRMDDDCVADPDVLEKLEAQLVDGVGAVGGSVIIPGAFMGNLLLASSSIDHMDRPNKQWFPIQKTEEVDHLHCSFLYRTRIANYDIRLSKKAHREETMFSYSLKLKGYKLLITPCVTWHFKSQTGGIRSDANIQDYQQDEWIFQEWLKFKKTGKKLYVLKHGLGDHYMFLQAIKPEKNCVIACCYPDIFKGYETISIAEASKITNVEEHDVYAWAARHNWKGTLIEAFKDLYKEDK